MVYTILFLVLLVATAGVMGWTLHAGLRKRRRAHYVRAVSTVVLLAATVYLAYLMSIHERALPAREMGIHRIFSVAVAAVVPLVAVTGLLLVRRNSWRPAHRACVGILVVATLGALGTGLWVLWLSTPLVSE